jgi:DNA-binding IclR family transcriptional regulator
MQNYVPYMVLPETPAPALARGITLLQQLTEDGQQPLEQLAARNQWPKSSVLRCLQTLEVLGAVKQDPASRHWKALAQLCRLEPPTHPFLSQMAEQLPFLAEKTGHCVELYSVKGSQVRLIDRADPANSEIVVQARVGSDRDLTELDATAALLYAFSSLEPPQSVWYWSDGQKEPVPAVNRDRMIQRVRETRLSMDHAFNQHGIRRFAIPLLEKDTLIGLLAVAQRLTPAFRADAERIQTTLQSIQLPTPNALIP